MGGAGFLLDLVLELVEGGDLLDFILTNDGLSEPVSQHITRQMCKALAVRVRCPARWSHLTCVCAVHPRQGHHSSRSQARGNARSNLCLSLPNSFSRRTSF